MDRTNSTWGGRLRWAGLILGFVIGAVALAQGVVVSGAAVVTETSGAVRFQVGDDQPQVVTRNRSIPAGAVVTTEGDASAVLTFADGQIVVLGERTRFRIVSYDFRPNDLGSSGAFLNLIEGSARLVLGDIGQHDPRLIRMQVGTGTLQGVQNEAGRGADAGVSVEGALTLLEVSRGRVSLTLPSGQSFLVGSGQSALVQPDGSVQQGSHSQIESRVGQTDLGKLILSRLDQLDSFVFPQRGRQQTVIGLATPSATDRPSDGPTAPLTVASVNPALPEVDVGVDELPAPGDIGPALNLPPLQTAAAGTVATGAVGGGSPCTASCN